MSEYTCHSGGALGADITWEKLGKPYGIKTISYSFYKHDNHGELPYILSPDELSEGWSHILKANKTLYRDNVHRMNYYIKNLLSRNWFQVKNSEIILAVGTFTTTKLTKVSGGTGWAVQMGIDNNKPVYVYDQNRESWFIYSKERGCFLKYYDIPTLTQNFAGIGTRDLSSIGKTTIKEIYEYNFSK